MPKGKPKPKPDESQPETKSETKPKAPTKAKEPKADQTVKKGNSVVINPGGKDKFVVKIESQERPFRVRQQAGSKGSCVVLANGKEYHVPQSPKMMDLSTQGIEKSRFTLRDSFFITILKYCKNVIRSNSQVGIKVFQV